MLFGKSSVHRELRRRKISLLLHSTHLYTNLPAILKDGCLRSAGSLKKQNAIQAKRFLHDPVRYEKYAVGLDYINCSLSEPNFELLYKRSGSGWESAWLHLELNTDLLQRDSTRFCAVSAARDKGKHVKSGMEGFKLMFADEVDGYSRESISKELPTSPQAEVMLKGDLPLNEIRALHVFNSAIADEVSRLCELHGREIPIRISPHLFIWPSRLINKKGDSF
ncbi:DUF4433 domain-containing protein [bacterium]|nr:DUF4433 domain-containing protein [bacterium]MBU1638218.1 DUF4433 domain-containing protein [bacterium]MBU1920998.1 DUF4433 domain-containing protein [bacterium]